MSNAAEGSGQQSLAAFQTPADNEASAHQSQPSQSETQDTTASKSPLATLYETLTDAAETQVSEAARALAIPKPIEPTSRHHTTTDIPEGVPALPFEIGQWELAVTEPDRVIYATSGDAYDYRWGEGGGLYGMEVYLNNRGANRDGKYHRRIETVVGFENGDKIQQKSVDSKDDLLTVRGHNVGENDGDYGFSTGTKTKAETAKEAVAELLVHLHHNPGAFGQYVNRNPDTDWALHKLSPRSATWTADGPTRIDDDTLRLSLHDNELSIRSNSESQSYHESVYYDLPGLDAIPETLIEDRGKTHEFETPTAAITVANELLSEPPTRSVAGGTIK